MFSVLCEPHHISCWLKVSDRSLISFLFFEKKSGLEYFPFDSKDLSIFCGETNLLNIVASIQKCGYVVFQKGNGWLRISVCRMGCMR